MFNLPAKIALIAFLSIAAYAYFAQSHHEQAKAIEAVKSPGIENVAQEVITPPVVTIYKDIAKAKLKLPAVIQHDGKKHVADSIIVPPSDSATNATSVFDEATGETKIVVIEEPKPWIAESRHGQIRFDYDVANSTRQAKRITVEQELFTVKDLRFSASAALDDAMQGRVSVGVAYRW